MNKETITTHATCLIARNKELRNVQMKELSTQYMTVIEWDNDLYNMRVKTVEITPVQ